MCILKIKALPPPIPCQARKATDTGFHTDIAQPDWMKTWKNSGSLSNRWAGLTFMDSSLP